MCSCRDSSYRFPIKYLSGDLARLNKISPKAQILPAKQASSTAMKQPPKSTRSAQPWGLALTRVCLPACPPLSTSCLSPLLPAAPSGLMALLTHTLAHCKVPAEEAAGWSHEHQDACAPSNCHWKPARPGTCLWARDAWEGWPGWDCRLTQQWQMTTACKNRRKRMEESEKLPELSMGVSWRHRFSFLSLVDP